MFKNLFPLLCIWLIYSSCRNDEGNTYYPASEASSLYDDGTYCASVNYYNPNTGTSADYELPVDIENEELVKIYWPNGGWLDDSHFDPPAIYDGHASFTSDKGYEYTIEIIGSGEACTSE